MQTKTKVWLGILAALFLGGFLVAQPPVWSRVSFHATQMYANIKYALFPPEKSVFTPSESTPDFVAGSVHATLTAMAPTAKA
jgi:hypothetical protein